MSEKQVQDAVMTIAKAVLAAEEGHDRALSETANLISTTLSTQAGLGLAAWLSQPTLEMLASAMTDLVTSRSKVLTAHREFGAIGKDLGATPEAYGPLWPCPSTKWLMERPNLRVAA